MKESLTKLATRGIIWTGGSQFITQFFRFAVTIILARLLFPDDFGLIGMAYIFIGIVRVVNELGLYAAIIQRKDINESHLSTTFWVSLIVGITLCLITIGVSPLIADFFQEQRVQPILSTLSLIFIIGSFTAIPNALLTKKLNFKKLAIAEIVAELTSGILAIVLALVGFGVWSLVWRMLLGNLFLVIILWAVYPWRPSMIFDFTSFRELFGFSSNVMGARVLNYVQTNMDYLIIGKFLGALSLGYYTIAYQLITFPLRRISWVITRVTFPTFSIIQEDNVRLRKGYLKAIRYISLVTFPMIAGLFIISPEFVTVVLGEKWSPAILPLQILCIAGAVRSVGTVVGSILLPKGRADIQFKWNAITLALLTSAILFGVNYGIVGVAIAVTIVIFFMYTGIQIIANRLIELDSLNYLKAIYPATTSSIFMILSIFSFKETAFSMGLNSVTILVSSIILGILVYLVFLKLTWKNVIADIKSIYRDITDKNRDSKNGER